MSIQNIRDVDEKMRVVIPAAGLGKSLDELMVISGKRQSTIKYSELESFFTSFQSKQQSTSEGACSLCNLDLVRERLHHNSRGILIVDTNAKKGHRDRIMVLTEKHGVQHPKELLNEAIQQLIAVGSKIFDSEFVLLSDKFSTVRYHWHIVASDLDPNADDFQQIMETPFVLVTKINHGGEKERKRSKPTF